MKSFTPPLSYRMIPLPPPSPPGTPTPRNVHPSYAEQTLSLFGWWALTTDQADLFPFRLSSSLFRPMTPERSLKVKKLLLFERPIEVPRLPLGERSVNVSTARAPLLTVCTGTFLSSQSQLRSVIFFSPAFLCILRSNSSVEETLFPRRRVPSQPERGGVF